MAGKIIATVTLLRNNRVTIPKKVREDYDLKPGDRIDFVPVAGGFQLIKIGQEAPSPEARKPKRQSVKSVD